MIDQRNAQDVVKLVALREATRLGFEAIERGDYKHFESANELADHLHAISDEFLASVQKEV